MYKACDCNRKLFNYDMRYWHGKRDTVVSAAAYNSVAFAYNQLPYRSNEAITIIVIALKFQLVIFVEIGLHSD